MAGLQFPWPRAERPLIFLTQLGQEEIAPSGTSYLNRAGARPACLDLASCNRHAIPHCIGHMHNCRQLDMSAARFMYKQLG